MKENPNLRNLNIQNYRSCSEKNNKLVKYNKAGSKIQVSSFYNWMHFLHWNNLHESGHNTVGIVGIIHFLKIIIVDACEKINSRQMARVQK